MKPRAVIPTLLIATGLFFTIIYPSIDFRNSLFKEDAIFSHLDYTLPAMNEIKIQVDSGNMSGAKHALLDYMQDRVKSPVHAWSGNTGYKDKADKIIAREFTVNGRTHLLDDYGTRHVNGRQVLDMNFHLNPDDDFEWIWQLNRGGWIKDLAVAARGFYDINDNATGDYYTAALVDLYTIFLEDEPVGSGYSWRTIDSAIRVKNIIRGFDLIKNSSMFTPEFCYKYLESLLDHGRFLNLFHKIRTNWGFIEMNHLLDICAYFPECTLVNRWLEECWSTLDKLVSISIYNDGGTSEQSIEYHIVMIGQVLDAIEYSINYDFITAPEHFFAVAEKMAVFLLHNTMPDGYVATYGHADVRRPSGRLGKASQLLINNTEIQYFDHNGNIRPNATPPRLNVAFPDSGIFLSRTAWNDENALFSYFDGGPFGKGYHQNNDLLNVMLYGFGRRLVIDPGRYTYTSDPVSGYLRTAHAHNTWTIDGKDLFMVDAAGHQWAGGLLGTVARSWHGSFGARAEREIVQVNFRTNSSDINSTTSNALDQARYWLISDFWHGGPDHNLALHWQLLEHDPVLIDNASNVISNPETGGIHCMKTNFPQGNVALYGFGPWEDVQNITAGDKSVHGQPYGYWSPDYNQLENATTYRYLGTTGGDDSWFTVAYPYNTSVNISVNSIPYTIEGNLCEFGGVSNPANVLVVNHQDGSKDLHVSRRLGLVESIPIVLELNGISFQITGNHASMHFQPSETVPSQILARDVSSLSMNGTIILDASGSTVSVHDEFLDHVTMGLRTHDGMVPVMVNGSPAAPSRYKQNGNTLEINLL
ncbi:hypothetical protein GF325_10540 [Candidatus Bathyarchaeota archaeon]|nr:hypothetical protein [Candidatus Bathyarchaeota archaeon]